jgi:hypothetical protein
MRFGLPDASLKIRYWTVRFVKRMRWKGACDEPAHPGKEIHIRDTLRGRLLLDTAIHEQLHAAMWQLDEKFVDRLATQLAVNIWKIRDRIFDTTEGAK